MKVEKSVYEFNVTPYNIEKYIITSIDDFEDIDTELPFIINGFTSWDYFNDMVNYFSSLGYKSQINDMDDDEDVYDTTILLYIGSSSFSTHSYSGAFRRLIQRNIKVYVCDNILMEDYIYRDDTIRLNNLI